MQKNHVIKLPGLSSSPIDRHLVIAARAVVRAHSLRDQGRRSDEDVSDAIADLKSCLDEIRQQCD